MPLNSALQDIWAKETLFQAMPILRFDQFAVKKYPLEYAADWGMTPEYVFDSAIYYEEVAGTSYDDGPDE